LVREEGKKEEAREERCEREAAVEQKEQEETALCGGEVSGFVWVSRSTIECVGGVCAGLRRRREGNMLRVAEVSLPQRLEEKLRRGADVSMSDTGLCAGSDVGLARVRLRVSCLRPFFTEAPSEEWRG
jgi:hypothetical protein